MNLPKIHVDVIASWEHCFDPYAFNDLDFEGDAIDVLNYEPCGVWNRFWVCLRDDYFPDNPELMNDFASDIAVHICGGDFLLQSPEEVAAHRATWEAMPVGRTSEEAETRGMEITKCKVYDLYQETDARKRGLDILRILDKLDDIEWARLRMKELLSV